MVCVYPRRSVLFMPGSNARALEKAKTLACDGVIFDLEDAVSPGEKQIAREQVARVLSEGGYGQRELVVRINGLGTPWWRQDLAAVVPCGPAAILIPKVESAEILGRVEEELTWHGGAEIKLWAMMETPRAFLRAEEIASASERLSTWVIGTNDLVKDLRAQHTHDRLPVITALGLAALVARTYGLTVIDGVYNDFKNSQGLEVECLQGKQFGFDGKSLIHPSQIEAANRIFGVSAEEVDEAKRLVAAFEEAAQKGKGVAVLDGRMVEELHVASARHTIAMAEAIAKRDTIN